MSKARELANNLFQYADSRDERVIAAISRFTNTIFLSDDIVWLGGVHSAVGKDDRLIFYAIQENLADPREDQAAMRKARGTALHDLNKRLNGMGSISFIPVSDNISIEKMQEVMSWAASQETKQSIIFDAQLIERD